MEREFHALVEGFAGGGVLGGGQDDVSEKASGEDGESASADVSKMKVEELKVSSRIQNALREAGIKTVGGLSRKKESALRDIEGLGEKAIREIISALAELGIALKE